MLPRTLVLAAMIASTFAAEFPPPAALPVCEEPPDLLTMHNGTKITTREAWETKRKPELRELIQTYEYGRIPAPPKKLTFETLGENAVAFGGKATLREVAIRWDGGEFALLVAIPNTRAKPAACFLGLNFNGNHAVVDDPLVRIPAGDRGEKTPRGKEIEAWGMERAIDRGYAMAVFHNGEIIPDDKQLAPERLKAFLPEGMSAEAPDAPATIACWAWGFMRAIDYLEKQPEIDGKRIAAVGHSRNGKTAILAAAMDERIALVIPSQAGCGGTAPCRMAPEQAEKNANGRTTAETVERINTSFPHWFCGNFKAFNQAVVKLPFDQHALIALCAPRPVLVSNAMEDLWANPSGQFAMVRAADPVYRLLSGEGCAAAEMPPESKLVDSRLGYFIRPGKHSMTPADWSPWLDYADRWLK